MDKKLSTFITIGILVIGLIAVGYYFSYQKPDLVDEQGQESEESQESQEDQPSQSNAENVIDGTFQKTENNLIYFYPKDKEEIETVELTTETIFSEITFSADLEIVGEEEASLTDFQEGDSISIIVSSETGKVATVRRMINPDSGTGQGQQSLINAENVIDGIFQKIESDFVYFRNKEDILETVELTEQTTFSEITLSASLEVVSEKEISSTDLQEGDTVSVIVLSKEKQAVAVRRMVGTVGTEE